MQVESLELFLSDIFLFTVVRMLSKAVYIIIPNAFNCFLGIGYSMSILGPAIGYVLGGQLLTLYIDVSLGQRQGNICFSLNFSFRMS